VLGFADPLRAASHRTAGSTLADRHRAPVHPTTRSCWQWAHGTRARDPPTIHRSDICRILSSGGGGGASTLLLIARLPTTAHRSL